MFSVNRTSKYGCLMFVTLAAFLLLHFVPTFCLSHGLNYLEFLESLSCLFFSLEYEFSSTASTYFSFLNFFSYENLTLQQILKGHFSESIFFFFPTKALLSLTNCLMYSLFLFLLDKFVINLWAIFPVFQSTYFLVLTQ